MTPFVASSSQGGFAAPVKPMSTRDHSAHSDADDWIWLTELCRATPASRQVGALADATADQEGADDADEWLRELVTAPLGSASVDGAPRLHESRRAPTAGDAETARSLLPPTAVMVAQSQPSQNYGPASRTTSRSVSVAAAAVRLTSRRVRFATAAGPTGRNLSLVSRQIAEVCDPAQTPSWSSGEHLICRAIGGSVLLVAQSRSSLAEQRRSIRRGHLMVWHFPLRPVGGVEWIALCQAAVNMVERAIAGQPTVFKIGLTSDPLHRWANFTYGYARDGYSSMTMLCVTVPTWAAALERDLIERFQGPHGCQNQAPGGESTPHQPPVFVYLVSVPADELVQWQLARARSAALYD